MPASASKHASKHASQRKPAQASASQRKPAQASEPTARRRDPAGGAPGDGGADGESDALAAAPLAVLGLFGLGQLEQPAAQVRRLVLHTGAAAAEAHRTAHKEEERQSAPMTAADGSGRNRGGGTAGRVEDDDGRWRKKSRADLGSGGGEEAGE